MFEIQPILNIFNCSKEKTGIYHAGPDVYYFIYYLFTENNSMFISLNFDFS